MTMSIKPGLGSRPNSKNPNALLLSLRESAEMELPRMRTMPELFEKPEVEFFDTWASYAYDLPVNRSVIYFVEEVDHARRVMDRLAALARAEAA